MGLQKPRARRIKSPSPTGWLRVLGTLCAFLLLSAAPPAAGPDRYAIHDVLNLSAGRGLRSALHARDAGLERRAEALLAGLAARHPIIEDHADLLRMRLLVDSERFEDAVAMGSEWNHDDSPLQSSFYELLGNAYAARGDEQAARRSWRRAVDLSDDAERRAALQIALARSLDNSGEHRGAAEEYLRVWTDYPASEAAREAEVHLDVLSLQLNRRFRSAVHRRRRGDAFFRERRNEEALAEYDIALASSELGSSERSLAAQWRADTLFRLRRYSEAAEAYAALPQDDEVRISRARSVARAGSVRRGIEELEQIGKRSRSQLAIRANYLAALLLEGEGEEERARALFEVVLRSGKSAQTDAALWRLGWGAYRAGSYADALAYFGRLEKADEDPLSRLRVRYWTARAKERSGSADAAQRSFAAIASEYPLSYYGWRSLPRTEKRIQVSRPVELGGGPSSLTELDFQRARILLEAGLEPEARAELHLLFKRARSLVDRVELAHLYANTGEFHRPQLLMVDAYTERLAQGPDPREIEMWWHAWPAPFREEVRGVTSADNRLDSGLLYAIMREESGYRPDVVSISGARGLLQLMPSTANLVARRIAMGEPSAKDLFSPRINIQLGAAYLEELLDRFGGRASAVVASYNAGPKAVAKWLARTDVEDDEWVESIPYTQTRGYVKRVLRSMHAYRVLY